MKPNLIKWRLMLTTLPVTVLVLFLKMASIYWFQYEGLVKFSEISLVITGGIFLIGFMLAGTLADYKESEKIPADIACTLEVLEDLVILSHEFNDNFDLNEQKKKIHEVNQTILRWFANQESEQTVLERIKGLSSIALLVQNSKIGSTAARYTGEIGNLRKLVVRAGVIRKTNFISTGYALLEVVTMVLIILLLIAKFDNHVIGGILICFVTHIFVYMIRLIRDIDQPFEYPENGKSRAAEISLLPLIDYSRRMEERLKGN